MPHLLASITAHGFGHAAISLPVLEALHAARPDVRLTIMSELPRDWLAARLAAPFDLVGEPHDFGIKMIDGIRVRAAETLHAYQALHADWNAFVDVEARRLAALAPDLVVSNVSYAVLAAAERTGIAAVALSSLNWADVFDAYCGALPGAEAVRRVMARAYAAAEVFLQPTPSMPMPSIANGVTIGPIARLGRRDPHGVRRRAGAIDGDRVVLVSMGGIPTPIDFDRWPRLEGLRVITGGTERSSHPDIVSWLDFDRPFIDLLASCDAVVAKPGYGLFVESVCNDVPLLHIPRDGWPETAAQVAWLDRHGRGGAITEEGLRAGRLRDAVEAALATPRRPPPAITGVAEAVGALSCRL